jgi:cell division protein FtsB
MGFGQMVRRGVNAVLPPALFLSLVGYFLWNATQGERGLQSYAIREQQLKVVQNELDRTLLEQKGWDRRVTALRPQRLDPDMLDERARSMLNVADPADIVVPYGQGKKLF